VGTLGSMVALEQYAICYYRRYRLALCMGPSNHKLFISKKEVKSALNLWTLGLTPKRVQVQSSQSRYAKFPWQRYVSWVQIPPIALQTHPQSGG